MWISTPWQGQTSRGRSPGGTESIIYGTVMGSIGTLHAFTSREDVDFFSHLELHMRQEYPPHHMAYRSAYFSVKFPTLPMDLQRKIADKLDRAPEEILKKPGIRSFSIKSVLVASFAVGIPQKDQA